MPRPSSEAPKRYEHLEQFVDFANLLEPGREWPTPEELERWAVRIARNDEAAAELDQARLGVIEPVWKEAARRFRPKVADRLALFGDATLQGNIAVFRRAADDPAHRLYAFTIPEALYDAAYTVRVTLRVVARAAASRRAGVLDLALPATPLSAQMAADGTLHAGLDFHRDFLLDALNGFDTRRIRECGECGRLYIAKRNDQPACSPACAGRRRQREFRAKH